MIDPAFHIAYDLAAEVDAARHRGVHKLPESCRSDLSKLETELWSDLMRAGSLWSNIRLVHEGRDLHPSAFMAGRIGDGLIVHSYLDTDKVTHYLADGATLIYNHLHESSRAVQRIQETLEYQLNARIWIQAYLTRTGESAFGLHVDDHNFIVLQLFGSKAWEIDFDTHRGDTSTTTTTLVQGDIIAIPANTPHRVIGCGTLSLHLTIAFDWLDDSNPGAVIPPNEADAHRAAARIGSTIPLGLCDDIDALRLPFKFRDRVRPTVTRQDRGVTIECHTGTYLIDRRFGEIAAELSTGRELTKAQMLELDPTLPENDLDKFLRFGIERQILYCSG